MEAIRRLRPVLACTAGVFFFASTAMAGPPYGADCCEGPGLCAPGGCDAGCTAAGCSCGCAEGYPCNCGPGCGCRSGGSGDRWWKLGNCDKPGPIGAEQKCRHGQLWPPYPRPQDNAGFWAHYHAAHYWPHPYNCWDRSWVKQTLAIQNANGWAQCTTLCAQHFDPETHMLNDAGHIHLRFILNHVPDQFRTVYIQSGDDQYVSSTREQSVRSAATAIAGTSHVPIQVRSVLIPGRPALEVDAIRRSEISTQPVPRIRLTDLGTGAGDDGAAEMEDSR